MKKKVVIVGGGFAGIQLTRHLDKKLFDVLLIDRLNHHQFQPLFYQVATSQIEPSSISFPLRHIFHDNKSIQIRMAEVKEVMPALHKIKTNIVEFPYDFLVLATGCKTNFFGNETIARHALTLKTTYDAISIRNHILSSFERMMYASPEERERLLNIVIVGAGPTGVELAGAFAEIKRYVLPRDYPDLDFSQLAITLVEGTKHTLANMSPQAQQSSADYLQKMGVQLRMETFVKDYDGKNVLLSDGSRIPSGMVIWAAGVTGNRISGLPDDMWVANGRIKVDRQNQVLGQEDIFALGDLAQMITPKYPKGHPQVANVAINQAKLLAKNLKSRVLGKSLQDYEYRDLGTMATIGRNKAVVDLPFLKFKGHLAWLTWMSLHLMLILSVRNKLIIFINWVWAYISKDSSLRLILKQNRD
jgi:NADH:ubiquinone reductase (H+-translocating)